MVITMGLWNRRNLEPPPITTHKYTSFVGMHKLHSYFKEAVQYFANQQILKQEAALLSRCIYRMKTKFRSDKGLKSMQKLNQVLLRYNSLKFFHILYDFFSVLPANASSEIHLPSRNMLDYVLIRLQGVAQLMLRCVETAKIMASNMCSRISTGHFWKVASIMLAIASRICIITQDILKECCKFYRNILPMRNLLKNVTINWLPEDYVYPESLENWLGIDLNDINVPPQFKLLKSHLSPKNDDIDNDDDEVTILYENKKQNFIENEESSLFELLMEDVVEIYDEENNINKSTDDLSVNDKCKNESVSNKKRKITKKQKNRKQNSFELLRKTEDAGQIECDKIKNINKMTDMSKNDVIQSDFDNNLFIKNKKQNTFELLMQMEDIGEVVHKEVKNTNQKVHNILISSDDDSFLSKCENGSTERKQKRKEKKKIRLEKQHKKALQIHNSDFSYPLTTERVESISTESSPTEKHAKKTKVVNRQLPNLNSVSELKKFMLKVSKERETGNPSCLFKKLDQRQWPNLRNRVQKLIKKAHKNIITEPDCLDKAKTLLEVSLKCK